MKGDAGRRKSGQVREICRLPTDEAEELGEGGRDDTRREGWGCEIPCIPEHNWVLAVADKETTVSQPQTRDSGLLPNGYVTRDQSFSLSGL